MMLNDTLGNAKAWVHATVACALICGSTSAQVTITHLGTLPGDTHSRALGISENGLVTGTSFSDSTKITQAFLWDDGVMIPLGFLTTLTPPLPYSQGEAVNDDSQVVGWGRTERGGRPAGLEGFSWQSDVMSGVGDLRGLPTAVSSRAFDINDAGQFVGFMRSASAGQEAYIRTGGTTTALGFLPGVTVNDSVALGVNSLGDVAGYSINSSGLREAVVWSGSSVTGLGSLSSPTRSEAFDLNNSGQVVGASTNAAGIIEAFLWESGVMTALGEGKGSSAAAINDSGQIVGAIGGTAVLWDGGTIIDLNTLLPPGSGWRLQRAHDINNAGEIVGNGIFDHRARAFLLRLAPNEPPTCTPLPGTFPVVVGEDGSLSGQISFGVPFSVTFNGDDPGDELSVSHSGLPAGATLSFTNGPSPVDATLDWSPTCDQVGVHEIVVTFTDSGGGEATCTLTLEVINQPPTCVLAVDENLFPFEIGGGVTPTAVHGIIVTAGQTLTARITGDDLDAEDELAWSATGVPAGATLTPAPGAPLEAVFEWTPTDADVAGNSHVIQIEFIDCHGDTAVCVLEIIVNRPPVAVCGSGQLVVECTSPAGADVTLDGTGSFDLDGDDIAFKWDVSYTDVLLDDQESPTPTGTFPIGVTMATLTVTDGRGGVSTCDVLVNVQDTTPPEVMVTTDVAALWPPKHDMRAVTCIITTSDVCENPDPTIIPLVVTVRSDEPDNATGNGDGNTTGDVNGSDGFTAPVDVTSLFSFDANLGDDGAWVATIQLRAERDGTGDGRAYVIDVIAFDTDGNMVTTSCVVVVPHDRRR